MERSHSWSSAPPWKGGMGEISSRVRIPSSPPKLKIRTNFTLLALGVLEESRRNLDKIYLR